MAKFDEKLHNKSVFDKVRLGYGMIIGLMSLSSVFSIVFLILFRMKLKGGGDAVAQALKDSQLLFVLCIALPIVFFVAALVVTATRGKRIIEMVATPLEELESQYLLLLPVR